MNYTFSVQRAFIQLNCYLKLFNNKVPFKSIFTYNVLGKRKFIPLTSKATKLRVFIIIIF